MPDRLSCDYLNPPGELRCTGRQRSAPARVGAGSGSGCRAHGDIDIELPWDGEAAPMRGAEGPALEALLGGFKIGSGAGHRLSVNHLTLVIQ